MRKVTLFALIAALGCDTENEQTAAPGTDATADAATADTAVADTTGAGDTTGSQLAPLLPQLLDCGTKGSAGGVAPGKGLLRVDIDTDAFPNARCNDGTGAIMYVRRHSDDQSANRWLIRLQGGGACRSAESCANRWCSIDSNFGMDKMTTSLAPEDGIVSPGVHALRDDNPFGTWNHAFLYYCSSDSWQGQGGDIQLTYEGESGETRTYTAHFRGADILDAALATLQGEAGTVSYTDSTGATQELPDLDDASTVVLAGASAGGTGTIQNLDRVAGALSSAEVYGLIDSIYAPAFSGLGFEQTPMCTEGGLCTYEDFYEAEYATVGTHVWKTRPDQSCLDWRSQNEPGTEFRCLDTGYVVQNHLTTPFFMRMDLQDPLLSGNMIESGFTVPSEGDAAMTPVLFAQLLREQLAALADLPQTAAEGAAMTRAPGWFGTACSKHETLGNNGTVFDTEVMVEGAPYTMFEVMGHWLQGEEPSGVIAEALGEGCP